MYSIEVSINYYKKETPVMAAVQLNKPGIIKYMDQQGIKALTGNNLLYAIKYKSTESFDYLFTRNTETKSFDISKSYRIPDMGTRDYFPIALAAAQKNKSMFYTLLEAGAEINFKKGLERIDTPIHFAVRANDMEMTKTLIEKGAKLDTVDHAGLSPLHWAAVAGNEKMTKFLIKSGAGIKFKGDIGQTPREYCEAKNSYICVKYLYSGGN